MAASEEETRARNYRASLVRRQAAITRRAAAALHGSPAAATALRQKFRPLTDPQPVTVEFADDSRDENGREYFDGRQKSG